MKTNYTRFMPNKTVSQKTSPIPSNITLAIYRDEYISHLKTSYSKSYYSNSEMSFNKLIEFGGNLHLSKVTSQIVEKFIRLVFATHKRQAAAHYRNLRAAFNKAIAWNYMQVNPCSKFKMPRIASSFPLFISFEDLKKIIEATEQEIMREMFLFGFFTGARLSEIVNLKWKSIDLKDRMLTIINDDDFQTKSKKERHIPMNKILFRLMKDRFNTFTNIEPEDYVFIKESGFPYGKDRVSKAFKTALKQTDLDDRIHFHTLRHSFASALVQNGASLFAVKELLGHSDYRTTMVYSHLSNDALKKVITVLDKIK